MVNSGLLIAGKFTLAAAIVGYIFHRYVDWPVLEVHASRCNWMWLLALAMLSVAYRFATARQIRAAFEPYGIATGRWSIMRAQYISSLCTLVLPGEIVAGGVKWHLLAKEHGHPIHVGSVLIFMQRSYPLRCWGPGPSPASPPCTRRCWWDSPASSFS